MDPKAKNTDKLYLKDGTYFLSAPVTLGSANWKEVVRAAFCTDQNKSVLDCKALPDGIGGHTIGQNLAAPNLAADEIVKFVSSEERVNTSEDAKVLGGGDDLESDSPSGGKPLGVRGTPLHREGKIINDHLRETGSRRPIDAVWLEWPDLNEATNEGATQNGRIVNPSVNDVSEAASEPNRKGRYVFGPSHSFYGFARFQKRSTRRKKVK